MHAVKSFLLRDPEHHLLFHKYVLNIIDWGRDEHFKEIQDALGTLTKKGGSAGVSCYHERTALSEDEKMANVTFSHVMLLLSVGGVARQYCVFSYVFPHLPSFSTL